MNKLRSCHLYKQRGRTWSSWISLWDASSQLPFPPSSILLPSCVGNLGWAVWVRQGAPLRLVASATGRRGRTGGEGDSQQSHGTCWGASRHVGDGCKVLVAAGPAVRGIHGWFCAAQVVAGWLEGTSCLRGCSGWGAVLPAGTRKWHRARAAGRRMRPVLSNVSPYLGVSLITSYLLFPKKKRRDQGWTEMLKSFLNSILFELRDL